MHIFVKIRNVDKKFLVNNLLEIVYCAVMKSPRKKVASTSSLKIWPDLTCLQGHKEDWIAVEKSYFMISSSV